MANTPSSIKRVTYDSMVAFVASQNTGGGASSSSTTAWTDITDKPTSFVPSIHSHSIDSVTGLRSELDTLTASIATSNSESISIKSASFTLSQGASYTLSAVESLLNLFEAIPSALSLVSPNNMTSYNVPSPYVVTDSGTYEADKYGWRAFNGTLGSEPDYMSSGLPATLSIDLGAATRLDNYKLSVGGNSAGNGQAPKNWTIEGSNDGTNWTIVDTRTNITGWVEAVQKSFDLDTPSTYRYYKIVVTAVQWSFLTRIAEFQLYRANAPINRLVSPTDYSISYESNPSSLTITKLSTGANTPMIVQYL